MTTTQFSGVLIALWLFPAIRSNTGKRRKMRFLSAPQPSSLPAKRELALWNPHPAECVFGNVTQCLLKSLSSGGCQFITQTNSRNKLSNLISLLCMSHAWGKQEGGEGKDESVIRKVRIRKDHPFVSPICNMLLEKKIRMYKPENVIAVQ